MATRIYSPIGRLLILLRHLSVAPSVYCTEDDLAEMLSERLGARVASRTLRDDLAALRRRRLVETGLPVSSHRHRRGIRRSPIADKADELRLNIDEHMALQAARVLLGGRLPAVAPTSGVAPARGRENARVEDALLLVRLLEEAPAELSVEDAAGALGVGAQQAARWLSEIADAFGGDLVDRDEPEHDQVDYRDLRGIELRRFVQPGASHLRGTGADLLGLFPYSRAEAEERLTLIHDARQAGGLEAEDLAALERVEGKLRAWISLL